MDLSSLFSSVWSVFLVVLFFGGSIFIHELGHFLAARRRGVHVERFSIGFGPKIFSWRGKDGVEYRLSWLPLGGYVALPQLADMSAIEGEASTDLQKLPPITYTTKLIVFSAGAFFNVLFALFLACILWQIGLPESSASSSTQLGYISPTLKLSDGTEAPSPAALAGLQVGDTVKFIDGKKIETWSDISALVGLGSGRAPDGRRQAIFTIERAGETLDVTLYPQLTGDEKDRRVGIAPGYPILIGEVKPDSPAARAGFQPKDVLLSINGTPIRSDLTLEKALTDKNATSLTLSLRRDKKATFITIAPLADSTAIDTFGCEFTTEMKLGYPSPLAQISGHVVMMYRTLASFINPGSDINLSKFSSPIGIMRIFYSAAEAGIRPVLWFTILININLAIFNMLPIPVLDGGHIAFATIAKLRRRPLPADFVATTQGVFMVLLLSVMLYVGYFDIRRKVREGAAEKPPAAAPATPTPAPAK